MPVQKPVWSASETKRSPTPGGTANAAFCAAHARPDRGMTSPRVSHSETGTLVHKGSPIPWVLGWLPLEAAGQHSCFPSGRLVPGQTPPLGAEAACWWKVSVPLPPSGQLGSINLPQRHNAGNSPRSQQSRENICLKINRGAPLDFQSAGPDKLQALNTLGRQGSHRPGPSMRVCP